MCEICCIVRPWWEEAIEERMGAIVRSEWRRASRMMHTKDIFNLIPIFATTVKNASLLTGVCEKDTDILNPDVLVELTRDCFPSPLHTLS